MHRASTKRDLSESSTSAGEKQKRQQVKLACNACRDRKVKCTGSIPCTRCQQQNLECLYDTKKDDFEELKQGRARYREALSGLRKALQRHDDIASNSGDKLCSLTAAIGTFLLQLPLDDADDEDIRSFASQLMRRVQNPPLPGDTTPTSVAQSTEINGHSVQSDWDILLQQAVKGAPKRDYRDYDTQLIDNRRSMNESDPLSPAWSGSSHWSLGSNSSQPFVQHNTTSAIDSLGGYLAATPYRQRERVKQPPHSLKSFTYRDGSLLCDLFFNFYDAGLHMLTKGETSILGSDFEIDVELFFRPKTPEDPFNVCTWASEIVRGFPDFDTFVQLACIYCWSSFMKWTMLPCQEHFHSMPSLMRPSESQELVPHRAVIDLLPIPVLREALLIRYRDWISCGSTKSGALKLDWPHPIGEAVQISPITQRRILTKHFMEYAQNPAHWTLHESVRGLFPEVEQMGFVFRKNK
ncbi:hypothetical protein K461DRAFT_322251 [Myriangium duriaei CBS 260.36]|uniref:Zn(2)-C6 fungal-type domain-containing protein n=1 Tax=Myriangium duriaei CBS 260.36 TaxID=1168546 RepID=A0A9P4J4E4_9PEZI|nr:hypothetical protein K461DRAFT_322251 [Myriangium duriaei CBS 260.36]